jgi:tetratricopeptide (TPR) repeat protein
MAEKALVAFGRYLKLLRERRGFSLDDVATLTKAYPEPVNKGYLSRAERGLSHIAFSKIVALGRAYEIPIDVFGEKLSLDLEVDQLKDAPDTEGKIFGELLGEGTRLTDRGLRLQGYAVMRDAVHRAGVDPVVPNYANRMEQVAAAGLTFGIASGALGRFQLARWEIRSSEELNALRAEFMPTASIQLSNIHRRLGDLVTARHYADRAVARAEESPSQRFLADAWMTRGLVANAEDQFDVAIEFYKRAYAGFRDSRKQPEAARAMANLASAYVNANRLGAARRAVDVAFRLATQTGSDGTRARMRILLGEIESLGGQKERAVPLWLEALEIAKRSHDRVAAFKAEFQLFKHALDEGHTTAANSFGRRLNRLWPWIQPGEDEVGQFRQLWVAHRPRRGRRVATSQRRNSR